jgi:hypothetical protein
MARETANNLQKQITPHLIGRLTDADLWTSGGTRSSGAADDGHEARKVVDDIELGWNLTQLRLTMRKSRAMSRPVLLGPGTVNTSVHRLSIGNMN